MAVQIPHLAVPIRFENDEIAVVEQDSPDDIAQCVEAVLRTIVGTRIDAPEYGISDPTFHQISPSPSAEAYVQAVERFEPRVRLLGEAEIEGMVERIVLTPERVGG